MASFKDMKSRKLEAAVSAQIEKELTAAEQINEDEIKYILAPEKDPDALINIMYDYLVEDYSTAVLIKPYVKEMLEKLREDGKKVYALTASPHRTVDPCLEHNGVAHLFDNVWSTDDLALKKSDPRIYEEVADRIGVRPDEIEFYDDNDIALRTAKGVGFRVIGVYDPVTEKYREEIESFADGYVVSFDELL